MQKLKTKLIVFSVALITLFFFSSDFSLIDIQKTAIIVAIGIDKKEDAYEITAQIAIPEASDKSSANNDAVIKGNGKTVMEAIDNIGIKTGWHPKLSFCNLVLLGKSVVEENMENIVDYLIASSKVQNSAIIAACDKTASEVLFAQTPLDALSAFALQKILLRNTIKVNTVSVTNLRQFAIRYYSPSNSGYMPLITAEKTDDKGKQSEQGAQQASTESGGGESQGGSSGSGGSGGSGGDSKYIFDATKTLVFSDGKMSAELTANETLLFNLLTKPVEESFISVKVDGEEILLSIQKNDHNIRVNFATKPELHLDLTIAVKIDDGTKPALLDKPPHSATVDAKYLEACKKQIEETVKGLGEKLKQNESDLFDIKTRIYKYHHSKFNDYKKIPVSDYEFIGNIKVESID